MLTKLSDLDLADILPIAIVLLDQQMKLLWWNKAAQRLFNLKTPDAKQLSVHQILENVDINNYLQDEKKIPIETTLRNHPETRISLLVIPYTNDQFLLLAQDITHVHHLERMRQDFVANVSHELRTPLTVIHGYLETLLEQTDAQTHWKNIFTQMYQQSLRMEKLVEDLLLLSSLESMQPVESDFRPVPVAQLLQHIAADADVLSGERQHQIHLQIDEHLKISGLENELQSAFSNLIFNAVNYTPARGHIYIHWYCENNCARLDVRDTGIGIAPEDIPRITERFYRVDKARSRSSGGTGLGLAIVKHALLHHQAQLKISSEFGKGSIFSCVFPEKFSIVAIPKNAGSAPE